MQSVHATKHSISSKHTAYRGMLWNAALRHVYFILAADSHDYSFNSGFVLWPQSYARQLADPRPRVEVTAPCMRFYAWIYGTSLLHMEVRIPGSSPSTYCTCTYRSQSVALDLLRILPLDRKDFHSYFTAYSLYLSKKR